MTIARAAHIFQRLSIKNVLETNMVSRGGHLKFDKSTNFHLIFRLNHRLSQSPHLQRI
jgi:hypothetical protein